MNWTEAVVQLKLGKSIRRPKFCVSWKLSKNGRLIRDDDMETLVDIDNIMQSDILGHIQSDDWEVTHLTYLTFEELQGDDYFKLEDVKPIFRKLSNSIHDFYNRQQNAIGVNNHLGNFHPDTRVIKIENYKSREFTDYNCIHTTRHINK